MRDGVVPKFEDTTMHRNDIVVATDHVASGDFVVPNLAENTGGESRKTIGACVVWSVGEAKDVKPADPELPGAMFAVPEAWGFEGPHRGKIGGKVTVVDGEIRSMEGVGTVISVRRRWSVRVPDRVFIRSTQIMGLRPCHTWVGERCASPTVGG
jgi:hypothetical protein